MRLNILGFALGVWLLQLQAALPGMDLLAALTAAALAAWACCARFAPIPAARVIAIIACATLGFAWAAAYGHLRLADRLDPALEERDVIVTGVVASLPQPLERGVRFEFDVESAPEGVPSHLLLSWYTGLSQEEFQEVQPLRAGERWRFTLRLRRPHGLANAHNYDYEAALLERGIGATGSVRPRADNERMAEFVATPGALLERVREYIRERFWDALPAHRYDGVLIALVIGEQRAIDTQDWQLFARTGVSHLMSISGLHITMIAGMAAWLAGFLWRRSSALTLALPVPKVMALMGFIAALIYCLLSGYAVPAQRTLYMIGVVALALWLGRIQSGSRVLSLALLAVLLLDPLALLSAGFWLSFGAVAVIFYVGLGRVQRPHWLEEWGRVQWAVTLGLAPALLALFQQVSIVSPLANAVAIPVVSFVVTPLALAGAVLPSFLCGDWLLQLSHLIFEWLMLLLIALSKLDLAVWHQHSPPLWTLALAMLGIIWMLAPRGFPARYVGLPLLAPMFAVLPPAPATGALWLTVIDVGQGTAVLARTAHHSLLYDAGPAFGPDSDSGSRTILPYLRGEGIARLDAMIVSHLDNDHAGGAASVASALPVGWLASSLPADHAVMQHVAYRLPCYAGQHWEWDGVRFEILHPAPADYAAWLPKVNALSCVLRIEAADGTALLTGDIERESEAALLARSPDKLNAAVLLVPHHGSRTSSTPEFIAAVAPRYAVFTAGYRNRFGHPRDNIVARYVEADAQPLRTDRDGAIDIRIENGGVQVQNQRERAARYWR